MKKTFALVLAAGLTAAASADVLVSYDALGLTGTEPQITGVAGTANLTAVDMVRGAGLIGNAGANSMNTAGWTGESTDYISFGFTVDAGFTANVDQLIIGTRSSGTGPGIMGVFYNGDGFTTALGTINQAPGGNFVNSIINLNLTGLSGNVEFRLIQVGTVSAGGGTTGSGGTFRVADYLDGDGNFLDTQLTGEIIVPAPGAFALMGLGGLVAARRRR